MSKGHLSPCPSCSRHVRVSESSCPHCGVATSEEFRARPAPKTVLKRLNRTALYAVGVGTVALATVACNEEDTGAETGSDAAYVGLDSSYGGPPADDAEADAVPDASDAAVSTDANSDAEPDAMFVLDAAYGGPPPDSSM